MPTKEISNFGCLSVLLVIGASVAGSVTLIQMGAPLWVAFVSPVAGIGYSFLAFVVYVIARVVFGRRISQDELIHDDSGSKRVHSDYGCAIILLMLSGGAAVAVTLILWDVPIGVVFGAPWAVGGLLLLGFFAYVFVRTMLSYDASSAAMSRANSGDVDGAVVIIRRAIEKRPNSANFWNTLGLLLGQQNEYEEALSALDRAVAIGGDVSKLLSNRAYILSRLSRLEEAIEVNSIAMDRDPENFAAAVNHCHFLVDLGRQAEAEQQLQKVEAAFLDAPLSKTVRKERELTMEHVRKKLSEGQHVDSNDDEPR